MRGAVAATLALLAPARSLRHFVPAAPPGPGFARPGAPASAPASAPGRDAAPRPRFDPADRPGFVGPGAWTVGALPEQRPVLLGPALPAPAAAAARSAVLTVQGEAEAEEVPPPAAPKFQDAISEAASDGDLGAMGRASAATAAALAAV